MSAAKGNSNVAIGDSALFNATTGNSNIALGANAGLFVVAGSSNIHIGNLGAAESNTTRIGSPSQTRTFIAGISGVITGVADAVSVVIDGNGQPARHHQLIPPRQDRHSGFRRPEPYPGGERSHLLGRQVAHAGAAARAPKNRPPPRGARVACRRGRCAHLG
jgi:hypothetical protein